MTRHDFAWNLCLTVAVAVAVAASLQATAQTKRPETSESNLPVPAADTGNTGVTPSLDLDLRPPSLWMSTFNGDEIGQMTAYDGMVYVVTGNDTLHALRVNDGKPVWRNQLGGDRVSGIACSCDGDTDSVVVTSYEGAVAVDRKTGVVIWKRHIDRGLAAPVIVGKRIYSGGYGGKAYALDLTKGEVLWKHDYLSDAPEDPPGFDGERARLGDRPARPCAASCDGETVFFSVFDQCRLIALGCKTGKRRWAFRTKGWMLGRPTITDHSVFVGSQDKHFYCIDKEAGHLVWKFKTGSRVEAPCAVTDRHVFFGSCDANLYCLSKNTGEVQWKLATAKRKKFAGPSILSPLSAATQSTCLRWKAKCMRSTPSPAS